MEFLQPGCVGNDKGAGQDGSGEGDGYINIIPGHEVADGRDHENSGDNAEQDGCRTGANGKSRQTVPPFDRTDDSHDGPYIGLFFLFAAAGKRCRYGKLSDLAHQLGHKGLAAVHLRHVLPDKPTYFLVFHSVVFTVRLWSGAVF